MPGDGPIGEAWLLSDRDDHPSVVADGPLKGQSLTQVLAHAPEEFLGKLSAGFSRFPVLLKFLDVSERLSLQVHPSDAYDNLLPDGETGKAEAWIILEGGPAARVLAGFKSNETADGVRKAIENGTLCDLLAGFTPLPGQAIFIQAGTIHSLRDAVVFEIQQNSDVTFRLYDWNQIDPRTGRTRPLQVEQALACLNFEKGPVGPLAVRVDQTMPVRRETILECEHFGVARIRGSQPFWVGAYDLPRVVVCIGGHGVLEHAGHSYPFAKGDLRVLPAAVGRCLCRPQDADVTLLEISI